MSSVMVRVSAPLRQELHELATREHVSMQDALALALEAYKRLQFIEGMQAGYAALRADPSAWADYQAEIKELDGVSGDGFEIEDQVGVPA